MTRPIFILILLLLAHAVVGAAAPPPSRSVEEALFDDVKPEHLPLLDPQRVKTQNPAGEGQGKTDRHAAWTRELGEAALPEETLPLWSVAERMRDVEGMLRRADCGPATQLAQRQIVQSLDQLLDQAAQQRSDGSTVPGGKVEGSPTSPTDKPGEPSSEPPAADGKESKTPGSGAKERPEGEQAGGEAKQVDTERARAMMKELWGELPPRQREQILQLPVEEFLPGYERLIEEYFRRLSEGKRQPATGED